MTFTKVMHDTKTAKIKAITQCTNGAESTSDCTLSLNTTNTLQIDIAVDKKVNGDITDSTKKADSKTDARHMNTVIITFGCGMAEQFKGKKTNVSMITEKEKRTTIMSYTDIGITLTDSNSITHIYRQALHIIFCIFIFLLEEGGHHLYQLF